MSTIERIKTLRSVIGEVTGDDAEVIKYWEHETKKLELIKNWLQHPITKHIYSEILRKAEAASLRLSTEGDMPEDERRGIFRDKNIYLWLLSIHHTSTIDRSLDAIEEEIASKTDEMITYKNYLQ